MKLRRSDEKLNEYKDRLKAGKASKIKRKHIEDLTEKLKKKKIKIQDQIEDAKSAEKIARLKRKLKTIGEQIDRAEWLDRRLFKDK